MTGFGKASGENESIEIKVEVKTLNSKFLDAGIRLPRAFSEKEIEVRNLLTKQLVRGKINVNVDLIRKGTVEGGKRVNSDMARYYHRELTDLARELGIQPNNLLGLILQMPEVLTNVTEDEVDDAGWRLVNSVIVDAIADCNAFRKVEGDALEKDLRGILSTISDELEAVRNAEGPREQRVRERIASHFERSDIPLDQIDQNRLEQEIIYYIEKLDINEEKSRLTQHINFFAETLSASESNGKKLGFIAQEMGREINTIGSKANDADIQRSVMTMKEELEKIKEQVLNIL